MKRASIFTSMVLVLMSCSMAACVCHNGCKIKPVPEKKFSGLDEETIALVKSQESNFSTMIAEMPDVVIDSCCNLFASQLADRYCTPRIDQYCNATYTVPEERNACLNGTCRLKVLDRCLRDVFDEFKQNAPTCTPMVMGTLATETKWQYPSGKVERCGATAPVQ